MDTIEFRSLPLAYQRLAAAEPTGRLSTVLGLESAGDSIELLKGLTKILATVGARVARIIQDIRLTSC